MLTHYSMNLWKYNKVTGYWNAQRTVTPESAQAWLAIFQHDEPTEYFCIRKHKPSNAPIMTMLTHDCQSGHEEGPPQE